jgi:hypothetical protein
MNILDLAAIVTVRNHINTVMNDKSVSNKEDFRPLNEVRVKLDKKFVSVLKELDVETLLSKEKPSQEPEIFVSNSLVKNDEKDNVSTQLNLPLEIVDKSSFERTYEEGVSSAISKAEIVDDEAADLVLIAERVKAQKDQLKKEGRSNKRKVKDDTAGQK